MRRVLAVLFLLVPALASAQFGQGDGGIRLQGVTGVAGTGSGGATFTAPVLFPDGTGAAPSIAFSSSTQTGFFNEGAGYLSFTAAGAKRVTFGPNLLAILGTTAALQFNTDLFLVRDAANTLALRNSTNAQRLNVYNSFTTAGSNYGMFSINATATGTDLIGEGVGATAGTAGIRSIQGCRSKAVVDNTATAFVRVAVADDDYEGGTIFWTAYAEDADTDARQTRTGTISFAILNNSGTEAATFSTGDSAVGVTAGTLTCTFDGNSAVNNTIDLRATCDTSLDAAAETLTFEWCLVMPSAAALTVQ